MSNFKDIERIARKIGSVNLSEEDKNNNATNLSDIYLKEFSEFKMQLTSETISSRICELKKMVYKTSDDGLKLNLEEERLALRIKELSLISSREFRVQIRNKLQTKKDLFQNSIRLILNLTKLLIGKRKYFLDRWLQGFEQDNYNDLERIQKMKNESFDKLNSYRSVLIEKSLFCLKIQSHERTNEDLRKILWTIKTFKAFELIIPRHMKEELARRVKYEIYENGRIIAREGHPSLRIFFVLSGQIKIIKKIEISSGSFFSVTGYLSKGDTTNAKDVERSSERGETMVSKGITEVLVVHRDDLIFLMQMEKLPFKFLNSISLLATYSFNNLVNIENSITTEYFSNNQIITSDAELSHWFYVIKSGHIKVLKPIKMPEKSKSLNKQQYSDDSLFDLVNIASLHDDNCHILDKIIQNKPNIQYAVIDLLGVGDVFGLHFIRDERIKKASKKFLNTPIREKLLLMSDESELILINKRAFMKYADVGTICQIENLAQRFLNEKEAYDRLKESEKWKKFKAKTVEKFYKI